MDPDSESALEACKKSVADAVKAAFLSPSAPLALITDASDFAIGAALEQFVEDTWQSLGFYSRKMSPTERRYSTYDRELLAIFSSIKHFKHIVEGREFVVKTDHKPLIYAFRQRPEKASPRQVNQLNFISQFTTQILHAKGEDNSVADALSRINTINMPPGLGARTIHEAQQGDEELARITANSSLRLQPLAVEGHEINLLFQLLFENRHSRSYTI